MREHFPPVLDLGSLTVASRSIPQPGPWRARARLGSGSHGYVEGEAADLVAVTGTVTRIRDVPWIYMNEGIVYWRVGVGPPRERDRTDSRKRWDSYVVDLEVED